jgi:hypothetical protein
MYKVLARDSESGTLTSPIAIFNPLCTTYIENEFVSNPHGPLMVFDNFADAERFASGHPDRVWYSIEIWKCEVKNPTRPRRILDIRWLDTDSVESLWRGDLMPVGADTVPVSGTIVADEVKITRRCL